MHQIKYIEISVVMQDGSVLKETLGKGTTKLKLQYQYMVHTRGDPTRRVCFDPELNKHYTWHEQHDEAVTKYGYWMGRRDIGMCNLWLVDYKDRIMCNLKQYFLDGTKDGRVIGDLQHFPQEQIDLVREEVNRILETAKTYPQYLDLLS